MLFVTLCTVRPGTTETAMRRRLEWRPPEGVKLVSEYWLPTDSPRVIITLEGNDPRQIFQGQSGWDDIFEMKTFPAITGEQGLEMSRAMLAERGVAAPAGVKIGV